MSKEDLEAHVQFDQTVGTVAVDWTQLQPGSDLPAKPKIGLKGFAEEFAIDTKRYFPFGLEVRVGEPDHSRTVEDRTTIEILAIDQTVVGTSGEAWNDYAARNGTLPYVRFTTKANLGDALRYIKRLDLILHGFQGSRFQETDVVNLP